ncbi:MAG: GerMN domain-containing protein, partial [Anaerolineae bacterium]
MNRRIIAGTLLLLAALLLSRVVSAQQPAESSVCFYREGQAAPVCRDVALSGAAQSDAELLLAELLAGPTGAEQEEGFTSPLPPGTELISVTVSGEQVVVDLR